MAIINAKICIRRDTAANWTSNNPTLIVGEVGFETDTGKMKVGSGVSWTSTPYTNTQVTNLTITSAADAVTGNYPHPSTDVEPTISYSGGAVSVAGGISVEGESWFSNDITIRLESQTPGQVEQPFRIGTGRGNNSGIRNTNTVVGSSILDVNTTGTYNTAVGVDSLSASTTASGNTAMGHDAMVLMRTGDYNSAFGYGAMGGTNYDACQGNAAFGRIALGGELLGANNTAIGRGASGNLSGLTPTSVSTATNRLTVGANHGFVIGQPVVLSLLPGGTLPSPLVAGTTYYVHGTSSTGIALTDTPGGNVIDITTTGTLFSFYISSTASQNTYLGANAGANKVLGTGSVISASNTMYLGAETRASKDNAFNEVVIGPNADGRGNNTTTINNTDTETTFILGDVDIPTGTLSIYPEDANNLAVFKVEDRDTQEAFSITVDASEGSITATSTSAVEWEWNGPCAHDQTVYKQRSGAPAQPANSWSLYNENGVLKARHSSGTTVTLASP